MPIACSSISLVVEERTDKNKKIKNVREKQTGEKKEWRETRTDDITRPHHYGHADTPDTISLVSFVLMSVRRVSRLLHSPALMRHNAGDISSLLFPPDRIATV